MSEWAERWPHLAALWDGYLHQDLEAVHGDAVSAVRAYLAEVSPEERVAVSSEWRTFLNLTPDADTTARAAIVRRALGGAWEPRGVAEFEAVSDALLSAWEGVDLRDV